jgi:hypothetical protein
MNLWKNAFKYLKIALVYPLTEIILNIIYSISFVFIGVLIFKESSIYDDHQILDMTESYLKYDTFSQIKTPTYFKSYLETILDELFTINPASHEIPMFIPMNPIRLIPFNIENNCNTELNLNIDCFTSSSERFKCVIDNLIKSFELKCGKKYSDEKKIFEKKLQGYYSSYNIRDAKTKIDITKETYYSTYQSQIDSIINDKQLKAIIMQINLIAPSNHNFIDVILGIEMTNYFTDVKTIFSVYILNDYRPRTKILFFLFFIFFFISVAIWAIKITYEINIKCVWSVHVITFLANVIDIAFIIICTFYLIEDKKVEFTVNLQKFESHLKYINILWYLKVGYSFSVIFFPFKILSLLSWCKKFFEPFIILLNIIFRMSPAIIITLIIFIVMFLMFVFVNYFLYNDIFQYYETIFQSLLSTFNIKIVLTLFKRKPASRIFGNLFQSKYSIAFIYFQLLFFYFYFSIIIATLVYAYKRAIMIQNPETDNKYIDKLKEIQKKIEKEKIEEFSNFDFIKKHILWWKFDGMSYDTVDIIKKYKALVFKQQNQIISFLKYIFAIQPELQFKKLINKFNIIIETNKKTFGEGEMKQIAELMDWLMYVGAKIPIIIYNVSKMNHSVKMKLYSFYKMTSFINDENALEKTLQNNGEKGLCISEEHNFSFSSNKNSIDN